MINIDEEFRSLIPPLTEAEYKILEESVLKEGCREPLTIWNNVILDGHHRYKICTEHNIPFKTQEIELSSREEAKVWIINNQLGRRNIPDFVKFELVYKKKKILLEMGREKMEEAGKMGREIQLGGLPTIGKPPESHNTQEEIAKELGWSHGKVAQAEIVWKKAPEEIKEKLRKNDMTIHKVYAEIKKKDREEQLEEEKQKAIETVNSLPHSDRYRIIVGDMATVELKEQFDFIISDPPYPYEYLSLYETLAKRSKEWLKKSGLLIVMCGQSYLDEIFGIMTKYVNYYWICAYLTPGKPNPLRNRNVNTSWKPVLVFGNDNYKGKTFGDVFKSDSAEKTLHEWQQSESGMMSIVKQFCRPGQNILDPFCGTGTTGVAALKNNCIFTGIEIDEKVAALAKRRLAND